MALQRCTSGLFVLVYDKSLCVSERGNENERVKQWGGVSTGRVSSKSQFNWTIVQFNLRLSGFTKACKAVLVRTIRQEKGGGTTYFGLHCILFLHEKLLCSLMQYDTTFTSSLMNQGLAKKCSVREILAAETV